MKSIKLNLAVATLAMFAFSSCEKEEPVEPGNAVSPEIINTDITVNTTLTNRVADSSIADYCITDLIAITNGAGLTIEPGVTIEFTSNAGLAVGTYTEAGYLIADGTIAQNITFTGKTKTAGFWRGITVASSNRDARNILDRCIIEYAGSSKHGLYEYKSAISVGGGSGEGGLLSIKNSIIRNTIGKGYSCPINSGLKEFFNNKFINNSEEAIFMGAKGFSKIDILTSFSGNGFDGIYQDNFHSDIETIQDSGSHKWINPNGPYFLSRGIRINNSGASLYLDYGVDVIMGSGTMIRCVSGTFSAIGQLGINRVKIRGEISGTSSWKGILIESGSNNVIRNCDISEGGSEIFLTNGCNGRANVGVYYWAGDAGKVTITGCAFRHSGGCGMYNQTTSPTQRGDLTQSDNSHYGNAGAGLCN